MAFRRIVWSARAKSDLSAILDFFYIRNGNKSYSRKLNSNIRKVIRLLRTYPGIGTRTDIQDVRALIHGNYIIFYETKPGSVLIIAIWDSRQDPEKLSILNKPTTDN